MTIDKLQEVHTQLHYKWFQRVHSQSSVLYLLRKRVLPSTKKPEMIYVTEPKIFIYSLIISLAFPALQLVYGLGWTSWEGFPLWLTSPTNGFVCAYKNKIHIKCLSCKAYWTDPKCQTISKDIQKDIKRGRTTCNRNRIQNVGKLMEGKVQTYMYIKASDLSTLDLLLQEKFTRRLSSCLDPGLSNVIHLPTIYNISSFGS